MASLTRLGGAAGWLLVAGLCSYGIARAVSAASTALAGTGEGIRRYPLSSLVHFGSAAAFALLIPFQLWAGAAGRLLRYHRTVGRFTFAAALVMVVSGLTLSLAMPGRPPTVRVFFLSVFLAFTTFGVAAFRAARARQFEAHRRWVTRMIATALGALTHRLIMPLFALQGMESVEQFWGVFLGSGWFAWALNLALAEVWTARTASRPRSLRARRALAGRARSA